MAVNVNGMLTPVCPLLTAIVPVYCSNGKFAGGLSASVTVDDAPGASDGMVAADTSDR